MSGSVEEVLATRIGVREFFARFVCSSHLSMPPAFLRVRLYRFRNDIPLYFATVSPFFYLSVRALLL